MVYSASLPTKLKSFSNFSRGLGGLTNGLLDSLCPDRTDRFIINPLHPNISMHILLSVLYTFPLTERKRIDRERLLRNQELL